MQLTKAFFLIAPLLSSLAAAAPADYPSGATALAARASQQDPMADTSMGDTSMSDGTMGADAGYSDTAGGSGSGSLPDPASTGSGMTNTASAPAPQAGSGTTTPPAAGGGSNPKDPAPPTCSKQKKTLRNTFTLQLPFKDEKACEAMKNAIPKRCVQTAWTCFKHEVKGKWSFKVQFTATTFCKGAMVESAAREADKDTKAVTCPAD